MTRSDRYFIRKYFNTEQRCDVWEVCDALAADKGACAWFYNAGRAERWRDELNSKERAS